jgi:hypothetical protein
MAGRNYYTAKEACDLLGMTYSALRNQVNAGNLDSFTPLGRRQMVYYKDQVDRLARQLQSFLATRDTETSIFERATKEDIPACVAISQATFGASNSTPTAIRLSWMDKNSELFYVVRADDQVVGYASIVPLPMEKILKILREEEEPRDITPDDIEEFEPGKPVDLYIMATVIKPELSKTEKRIYGAKLVNGLMETLIALGGRGVIIHTLIGRSRMPDGIRILRRLGFAEPKDFEETVAKTGKRIFVIEVEQSAIPLVQQYRQALAEYQSKLGRK